MEFYTTYQIWFYRMDSCYWLIILTREVNCALPYCRAWAQFQHKDYLPGMWIPSMKMRRPWDNGNGHTYNTASLYWNAPRDPLQYSIRPSRNRKIGARMILSLWHLSNGSAAVFAPYFLDLTIRCPVLCWIDYLVYSRSVIDIFTASSNISAICHIYCGVPLIMFGSGLTVIESMPMLLHKQVLVHSRYVRHLKGKPWTLDMIITWKWYQLNDMLVMQIVLLAYQIINVVWWITRSLVYDGLLLRSRIFALPLQIPNERNIQT